MTRTAGKNTEMNFCGKKMFIVGFFTTYFIT